MADAPELPAFGTVESDTVDFKLTVEATEPGKYDHVEMAKDVAAFANAFGGALYIGADDDRIRLTGYRPLPFNEANQIEQAYVQAVAARCRPKPSFTITRVVKDGGFVVVVQVSAYPAATVGVLRRGREVEDEGPQQDSYMFPIRRGQHTQYLDPGQLALIQLNDFRRAAILLKLLPEGRGARITVVDGHGSAPNGWIEKIDFDRNTLTLGLIDGNASAERTIMVPITCVQSAWHAGGEGWKLSIGGRLKYMPGSGWLFQPP